jgi:hypothetical protein
MSGDKLNLDLIQMVQQARRQHDQAAIPSQASGVYWIEARCTAMPALSARTGEWRIATTLAQVDQHWETIRKATEANQLGYKAKVSTTPAQGQAQREQRMICIRTYDADDLADVERIRQTLEQLGFSAMRYVRD